MSLLELIGSFLEPFLDLVPRIAYRPASNQYMVVDRWYGGVKVSTVPVLHCPMLTHVEYFPRWEEAIDCGVQKLTTSCGKPVIVNATARVLIIDPIQLRAKAGTEWSETVAMQMRARVCEFARSKDEVSSECDSCLSGQIAEDLIYFGIELAQFQIEDAQEVMALSITS